ncbi:PREDICTED: uncharacterized protein LOC104607374 [Nelumbo nucifera]|uniref:Uncharacterized protein LOC104607374 n=2 Tax=Nelumbo nucifera TaxID=4432 RepID=A0A1U8AX92_NELNU|nr:PREDICTED: uncharacterized protein LOC104607374 [Nelumbo nucifera]DAD41379.1 TPA_asm: hypothetical protein HUJ06_015703 [Nelumbo nucifera]
MAYHYEMLFFLYYLIGLSALQGLNAVEYQAFNYASGTTGGTRFDTQIGVEYSREKLKSASEFIWQTFRQTSETERKSVQSVSLFVETMADGMNGWHGVPAYAVNNEIHVNATYIEVYKGDVNREITGILYHEVTHVWQWDGNGQPGAGVLIEGVADFIRLKAGYAPSHWVKPGEGNSWDQGYDVTAHFLDYCDGLKNGFVAELNAKMKTAYSAQFFVELLGKTVDQLWADYKAKYGN